MNKLLSGAIFGLVLVMSLITMPSSAEALSEFVPHLDDAPTFFQKSHYTEDTLKIVDRLNVQLDELEGKYTNEVLKASYTKIIKKLEAILSVVDDGGALSDALSAIITILKDRTSIIGGYDISVFCEQEGGTWLNDYKECEYLSEEICNKLDGEYNECGSACRNDENAEICTEQCVQYCDLDTNNGGDNDEVEDDYQKKCELGGGTWLDGYKECEYTSEATCMEIGGEFNECGSACRHEEGAVACTMQCVPYCALDLD